MSKQFLKYLLLLSLPLLLSANFVNWLGNYDAAHQKALKENKPLLVFVVKKNDPLSSAIIKNSFMNKNYVDVINTNMIPVIVTYEGTLSYPIEMYYTTEFPALFFVESDNELIFKKPLYGRSIYKENVKEYLIELLK